MVLCAGCCRLETNMLSVGLQSGRYASTLSMQGCVIVNGHAIDLPRNVSTVADRLGKGGWKSAAFGKWDAGMTTWDFTPTCRGFDYFCEKTRDPLRVPAIL